MTTSLLYSCQEERIQVCARQTVDVDQEEVVAVGLNHCLGYEGHDDKPSLFGSPTDPDLHCGNYQFARL